MTTRRWTGRWLALVIGAAMLALPALGFAQNLLLNGDFSEGAGNLPAHWQTQSWVDLPANKFMWIPPSATDPGLVAIETFQGDSRWVQTLHLVPGWYYIGAEAKAVCKWQSETVAGAMVGLTDLSIISDEMKPTDDWQNLSVYVKVGAPADVQVALRLNCPAGYYQGHAMFRGASVIRIDAPPPDASPVFDLDQVRHHFSGSHWSILGLMALLMIGAAAGWMIIRLP